MDERESGTAESTDAGVQDQRKKLLDVRRICELRHRAFILHFSDLFHPAFLVR